MPTFDTVKKVLILGMGVTGLSLARWFKPRAQEIIVFDTRTAPPKAQSLKEQVPSAKLLTGGELSDSLLRNVELVAVSPGVPLNQAPLVKAKAAGIPIVGDIELFARQLPAMQKVLAITGTNGKSTVTELAGQLCRAAGLQTCVAGNIGEPVLDCLWAYQEQHVWPDVFVLELSSFQLECTQSLNPTAATVLNISEDHLDRYADIAAYAAAKARIFSGNGIQILNRDDARVKAMSRPGRTVWTFGASPLAYPREWGLIERNGATWLVEGARDLLQLSELRIAGRHNALNVLAALALVRTLKLPYEPLLDAVRSFAGLAHRVEVIAEHAGVVYIDDSKGTNVGATVAALSGLGRTAVLIAGGEGKGQNFAPLRDEVAQHCRAVVLIGRDREQIAQVLQGLVVPVERCATLPEAVQCASRHAQAGDAVLLSPACASFDMFRDYLHRSAVFAEAVRSELGATVHA